MSPPTPELPTLIGQSTPFLELMDRVSRAAPLDRPVIVVGERGTGKELVAARLHYLSGRWDQPLVKVNCAALPETLLETELFGHEAGAFTGAVRRRVGRFERAHRGSLFLDETATASMAVQEKVLRVIEYGEMERVGSSATVTVDARVIAATNVDLAEAADAGRFRHDLLDRLAFDVLSVPPLRARTGDIPLMAEHFGRAMASELGWDAFPGFAPAAMEALAAYPWPGNVREIKNVVERAVYRWDDPAAPVAGVSFDPFQSPYRVTAAPAGETLPRPAAPPARVAEGPSGLAPIDLTAAVAGVEKRLLEEALAANRYSQRATARHLRLSYHQLRNKLRKHGLGAGGGD